MNIGNNGYQYVEEPIKKKQQMQPLVRRIADDYRFFGGLSAAYGAVFAFCLYKNLHGITFPLCIAATIGFAYVFMKKIEFRLQKGSGFYIAGMILLGISTAYTSSFFFHFFNMAGIILLFFVFMIHQFYNDYEWNLPGYLKRMLILLGTTIECIPYPIMHGTAYFSKDKSGKNRTAAAIGIGAAAAAGMLCIILPLLLKSDLMFSKIF